MRRLTLLLTLTLLGTFAASCNFEAEDPDGDDRRGRAVDLPLGQVVTDKLAPPEDRVDWKIVTVPGEGFITVTVFWDDPAIDSRFQLVDQYGIPIEEKLRDRRSPNDQIIVRSDSEGFYFIRIEAEFSGSTYSVQANFSAEGGVSGEGDVPIPEFVGPIDPGTEGEEVTPAAPPEPAAGGPPLP